MRKRKPVKKQNSVQTIFSRFMLIVALFAVWIGIIGVRLVQLQVNQHETYREKALSQRRLESKTKTLRGSILDRSNRALAVSVPVKTLYADPRYIDDVPNVSQRLSSVLKVKAQDIARDISDAKQKQRKYLLLARKIDVETAKKIGEQLKDIETKQLDGQKFRVLYWVSEQKRSYPFNSLAAQVIGFSDMDDNGKAGIEFSQEKNLRGAVIEKWKDRDRLGRVYEESENEEREPPKDVVLTINSSIQYKVEEALRNGVENAKARSGMAIVLDAKTGEILSMANYPTFDLNKFNEANSDLFVNKAVQNSYSPGSVFKLVTYGSALEERLINPEAELDCNNGSLQVAGRIFTDRHCVNRISYSNAFAISSNIGAIKTGQKLGKQKFFEYINKFGFGQVTGVELPAESRGIVRALEGWNGDSLASMSIGYEIGVTALQSASAFATIANDGVRVKPHIIKEIRQGETVISTTEVERTQIVRPETARQLRSMMQRVVLAGTGKRAQLNGYSSAGKTGTAWKYDSKLKKINENKIISSFIGFASMENPSIVIAVILDEPKVALRDGGHVSAPIFRDIAEQILPELNMSPDGTIRQEIAEDIVEGKEFPSEVMVPQESQRTPDVRTVEEDKTTGDKFADQGDERDTKTGRKIIPKKNKASTDSKPQNRSSGKEKT